MENKKDFIELVVDLETLGVADNAQVIQISAGAFKFSKDGVHFIKTFDKKVDLNTYDKLTVEPGTLTFWLNRDEQINQLKTFLEPTNVTEFQLWKEFEQFLLELDKEYTIRLWGNGSVFDNVKVRYNLKALNLNYPVMFFNERDIRTVVQLYSDKEDVNPRDFKNSFVNENQHDALSDVKWEAEFLNKAYTSLT